MILLWNLPVSPTTVGFSSLGPLSGELSIFLFPRAHASGGTRETGKTQEEYNNSEIYEISEVQCARKHVSLWLGQTVEIWQLFYCYNSSKDAAVYSNIILLHIKYIFQRKLFFFFFLRKLVVKLQFPPLSPN